MEGINSNGCTEIDSTIVLVNNLAYVYGQVLQSNGNPLEHSTVYLMIYDQGSNSYVAIDSTQTGMNGNYHFETKEPQVYIKVVPDSTNYPNQLATLL